MRMDMKTTEAINTDRGAYSIDRFAEEHDISRSQTYVEINNGRLIASKVGNRTVITRENAARWRKSLPRFPIDARATKTRPVQPEAAGTSKEAATTV
jgi:hypothetical protein